MDKSITIIPNLLNFTYTKNTGAAFGIGTNNIIIINIINIIVIAFIIKFLKENKINTFILFSLILILSGGIGNLIDRLFRGYVIDFIDVNILDYPHFNIADISIVIGVFLLIAILIKSLFEKKEKLNVF